MVCTVCVSRFCELRKRWRTFSGAGLAAAACSASVGVEGEAPPDSVSTAPAGDTGPAPEGRRVPSRLAFSLEEVGDASVDLVRCSHASACA